MDLQEAPWTKRKVRGLKRRLGTLEDPWSKRREQVGSVSTNDRHSFMLGSVTQMLSWIRNRISFALRSVLFFLRRSRALINRNSLTTLTSIETALSDIQEKRGFTCIFLNQLSLSYFGDKEIQFQDFLLVYQLIVNISNFNMIDTLFHLICK